MRKILLLIVGVLIGSGNIWAYTDQITVKADEAYQAALDALKATGFKKADPEKRVIETKWVQDRVVRKGKWLLKSVTSQTYDRRYRLVLRITQRPFDTEIEVRGVFQERPIASGAAPLSWRKIRPRSEDFDIERATFMRILSRLQDARSGAA